MNIEEPYSVDKGLININAHDLCSKILKNKKCFSSFYPLRASTQIFGVTVFDVEEKDHARLKSELGSAFSQKKRAYYVEHIIEKMTLSFLNDIPLDTPYDVKKEICEHFPISVMSEIIGLPADKERFFYEKSLDITNYLDLASKENFIVAKQAADALKSFFSRMIKEEEIVPGSLVHQLINSKLSCSEVVQNLVLLVPAAVDTTTRLLAICLYFLSKKYQSYKEQLNTAARIQRFVEEIARHEPPIRSTLRVCIEDYQDRFLEIKRHSLVNINIYAANHDSRVFRAPNSINLERGNAHKSLTFGGGVHQCIGKFMALDEVSSFLRHFIERFSEFSILDGHETEILGKDFINVNQLRCRVR